ncbi:hypothetical protein [Methyloversatilis sp. RAC08]|uniref:hypothetical protein n=1 Tax=Methyloversatilis sp. RAC08 TaxID=1842540 RepID=UPI00167FFF45|nr:hypothetical protein [Methyloversatilis sp. RAC08]
MKDNGNSFPIKHLRYFIVDPGGHRASVLNVSDDSPTDERVKACMHCDHPDRHPDALAGTPSPAQAVA